MLESFKRMFKNALNFKDRTSRKDFWNAFLMTIIIGFILGLISGFLGKTISIIVNVLFYLVLIIPTMSMDVRRLHDSNKSGWYLLMELIPIVGWIFVLVAFCSESVEPNKYGKLI